MTRDVIYNNMIVFLALDLAYVRPQLSVDLRKSVLARNDGRCVICNSAPAAEVDHIRGGSSALENLRGLCRHCHEAKPRGPIPDDLTRDGNGTVDFGPETRALQSAWRAALLDRIGVLMGFGFPCGETLDELASGYMLKNGIPKKNILPKIRTSDGFIDLSGLETAFAREFGFLNRAAAGP